MINPAALKAYNDGERIPDPFRGFLAVFYTPGRRPVLRYKDGKEDNRPPGYIKTQPGGTDPGGGFLLPVVNDHNRNQGSDDGRKRNRGRLDLDGLKTAGGFCPGFSVNASMTAAAFLRRLSLYMLAYDDGGGVLYASMETAKMKRFTRGRRSRKTAVTPASCGLKRFLTVTVNDSTGQSGKSGEYWKKEVLDGAHKHPRARIYRGEGADTPIYIRAYIVTRPGIPIRACI